MSKRSGLLSVKERLRGWSDTRHQQINKIVLLVGSYKIQEAIFIQILSNKIDQHLLKMAIDAHRSLGTTDW